MCTQTPASANASSEGVVNDLTLPARFGGFRWQPVQVFWLPRHLRLWLTKAVSFEALLIEQERPHFTSKQDGAGNHTVEDHFKIAPQQWQRMTCCHRRNPTIMRLQFRTLCVCSSMLVGLAAALHPAVIAVQPCHDSRRRLHRPAYWYVGATGPLPCERRCDALNSICALRLLCLSWLSLSALPGCLALLALDLTTKDAALAHDSHAKIAMHATWQASGTRYGTLLTKYAENGRCE